MTGRSVTCLEDLGGMKKLTAQELAFMQVIWNHPEGISTKELYENFDMANNTKTSVLHHISNKGYLEKKQEGLHFIYTYTVSRTEYERAVICQQLKEMQRERSLFRVVAAFCGKETLTEEQKAKVQDLLEELKKDSKEGAGREGSDGGKG